ncbi:hypothetical protein KPH14_010955 [Odynerus spinipes]|uniref:C2H2-type domain-containing protein n=1 Tax=Odynerus spinipes TaxID=1348599 RepID=A0AAD9VUV6_9HYME|nr:hypothetical protein KPH14_010955 [Odynerus spinipes]
MMEEIIEIVKVDSEVLLNDGTTQVLLETDGSEKEVIITKGDISDDVTTISQSSQIIQIITDYECVTCHRIFQSEDMLKEHLDVCREEDDSTNILELGNLDNYDSEDEEDGDDPDYEFNDTNIEDTETQKNNNEKPIIKPVPDTQCHCCAEDLKTAHNGGEFKCSECELSFKKNSSLERHKIVIHWKCDSYACSDCGSSFRDKKSLNKHRYTTHVNRNIFK